MLNTDINYWIVGSMLGGTKEGDIFQECIERGYWYCWENPDEQELTPKIKEMRSKFGSISPGDRIAIKKQLGTGKNASFMEIRAIGVVNVVDTKEWRVYVDWLIPQRRDVKQEMKRRVPKKGPGGITSISGPYKNDLVNSEWLPQIFCI
ncbi:MAG: hypothetical protein JSR51_11715 [Proteobacteria bacterium]|jgi:hypothetical protein|nr:hypothetical protein [Pseudomonadota bacterium]